MKTLTAEIIQNYLKTHALDLKSTHHQLSIPIMNRIFKKMKNGIKFSEIKIHENLIIDGHHRYISAQLANYEIKAMPFNKNSETKIYEWENVKFVNEEWDTIHKIQHLNKLDAEYNQISIELINQMIE